jgi:hypothetical protein
MDMESVLTSDIFFFITSISVMLLTLVALVILYYGVKIIRHISYIAQKIRNESDNISKDIEDLRTTIKKSGTQVGGVISSVIGFVVKYAGSSMFGGAKKHARSTSGSTASSAGRSSAHTAKKRTSDRSTSSSRGRDRDDDSEDEDDTGDADDAS